MKKQIMFDSAGAGKICATIWEPQGNPLAIVQIIHGIAEHVERYDDFATYLNGLGYLVVAEDHMGHGNSVKQGSVKGYFHGGWWAAVEDVCALMDMTMKQYPDVPYILFGHSMGSFMARSVLTKYPDSGIAGCVICGTGWQPEIVLRAGLGLAGMVCKLSDPQKPSMLLHNIAFGSYNKRVEHPKSQHDWLSRDAAIVDKYDQDDMCGFVASAGLMRDMFEGISYIQKPVNLQNMRKDLPVYFIAGGDDPVGEYGNGVRKAAQAFEASGMVHVSTKIYPLGRHEILNEINKMEVYEDVVAWISNVINGVN